MSFKESFERSSKNENLIYDDSAFYFYALAMLTVTLIPLTFYLVIKPVFSQRVRPELLTSKMKERLQKTGTKLLTSWYIFSTGAVMIGWIIAYACFLKAKNVEALKFFEPYELLGIKTDATEEQIKKAYRELSRSLHPDKNRSNPEAANEFILLTKAYTILTDERARGYFLKYGDPEGKKAFTAVGVALPKWLHLKISHLPVMLLVFLLVVIVIPYLFAKIVDKNQQHVDGNVVVDLDTRKFFHKLIAPEMNQRKIPGILQFSTQFQTMKVANKKEFQLCKRLKEHPEIAQFLPAHPGKKSKLPDIQVKPIVLLVGYILGILEEKDVKQPDIKKTLQDILEQTPGLVDVMIQQAIMHAQMRLMGRHNKKMTAKSLMTLIQFLQNVMTGGFTNKSPFSQLADVKGETTCLRIKEMIGNKTFYNYCGGGPKSVAMTKEERLKLAPKIYDQKAGSAALNRKFDLQERFIEALPIVKLTMTAEVAGEKEIYVGDVLTVSLTIEGMRSDFIHSKCHPIQRRDKWFLIITDEDLVALAAIDMIYPTGETYKKEFQIQIQRKGRIAITAILTNDSYRGLDQIQKVVVQANVDPQAQYNMIGTAQQKRCQLAFYEPVSAEFNDQDEDAEDGQYGEEDVMENLEEEAKEEG